MRVIDHEWVDDRTVKIVAERDDDLPGTITAHVSWPTYAEAQRMYQQALDRYRELPLEAILGSRDGQGQTARRILPHVYLTVLWGPPTWWLPRADLKVTDKSVRVMFGWLRRAVVITWFTRRETA